MRSFSLESRLALLVVAAVSLGPIAACSDDGPKEGEASFELEGSAVIERQDGDREELADDDADVRVGDRITILEGAGTLELPDGTILEMRTGFGGADDTKLVMGPVPVLEQGDLLVITPAEVELSAGETAVVVTEGAAKLTRDSGVGAAAYDSEVRVNSAGQAREVPALREVQVPALGQPDEPRPLAYDGSDPWDRRFLGTAIDLGDRLEALATGYTQSFPRNQARTVEFFRGVLPGLVDEAEFTAGLLDRNRPPGETLVGAAIAELGRRGDFVDRWGSVFSFRDAGAAWGLVALDQGVDGGPLIDAVTAALSPSELAIGPVTRPGGGSSTTAPPTTDPVSPTTSTTRPRGTTTSSPPATFPPDPPSPLEPVLGPLLDPVGELLSSLLGGLLGGLFNR